jgi:hypothetical protein
VLRKNSNAGSVRRIRNDAFIAESQPDAAQFFPAAHRPEFVHHESSRRNRVAEGRENCARRARERAGRSRNHDLASDVNPRRPLTPSAYNVIGTK